jgi:hypothetical protein
MCYPRTEQERIRIIERYCSDTANLSICDDDVAQENFGANDYDEEADEDDNDD